MRLIPLCAASVLVGCASFGEPYWQETHLPYEVSRVIYVDKPCNLTSAYGTPMLGCANYYTNTIEIQKGLTPAASQCVLTHERKHFAGYSHSLERPHYSIDCGDGTML